MWVYRYSYTGHSYKISIMIWTILTKTDCTATNNSYTIIKNNNTNNNMLLLLEIIIVLTLFVNWHCIDISSAETQCENNNKKKLCF